MNTTLYDRAVKNLGVKNTFRLGDRRFVLACLVRDEDRRPLKAEWWKGQEVSVVAVDVNGNFFLRHGDGSVRHWDHQTQTETFISPSIKSFIANLDWSDQ